MPGARPECRLCAGCTSPWGLLEQALAGSDGSGRALLPVPQEAGRLGRQLRERGRGRILQAGKVCPCHRHGCHRAEAGAETAMLVGGAMVVALAGIGRCMHMRGGCGIRVAGMVVVGCCGSWRMAGASPGGRAQHGCRHCAPHGEQHSQQHQQSNAQNFCHSRLVGTHLKACHSGKVKRLAAGSGSGSLCPTRWSGTPAWTGRARSSCAGWPCARARSAGRPRGPGPIRP